METKIVDASDAKNSGWTDVLKDVAEKVMPDSVFFEGIIHPTAKKDSYNGLFLREKDIKKWQTKITNTDLLYEHDKTKKVGKILGGRMDAEKKFRVLGYVDTSKIGGIIIAEKMRRGELNGLSIGKFALATEKENGEKIVEEHDIFEVSVVQDPDLEGAFVHYVQPHNKNQLEAMKRHQKESTPKTVNEEIPAKANEEPGFFSTK